MVLGATRSSKLPSRSVMTPLVVPGTTTEAPTIASPLESNTLPLMADWAKAEPPMKSKATAVMSAISAL